MVLLAAALLALTFENGNQHHTNAAAQIALNTIDGFKRNDLLAIIVIIDVYELLEKLEAGGWLLEVFHSHYAWRWMEIRYLLARCPTIRRAGTAAQCGRRARCLGGRPLRLRQVSLTHGEGNTGPGPTEEASSDGILGEKA